MAELDHNVPKEVTKIIEDPINIRLKALKEFCDTAIKLSIY